MMIEERSYPIAWNTLKKHNFTAKLTKDFLVLPRGYADPIQILENLIVYISFGHTRPVNVRLLILHIQLKVLLFIYDLFHHIKYVAVGMPWQFIVNVWIQAWHGRVRRYKNKSSHNISLKNSHLQTSVYFYAPINVYIRPLFFILLSL